MSDEPGGSRSLADALAARAQAFRAIRYHWPAVWVVAGLAVLVVFGVDLLPARIFAVTMSIDAMTEVLELELDPRREYVWTMPAGSYSLVSVGDTSGCARTAAFEVTCAYPGRTVVWLRGGPTARLEVVPQPGGPPRFALSITPREAAAAKRDTTARPLVEIRGANDETLATTSDYVGFEATPIDHWRIPLTLTHLQLGESLRDNFIATDDSSREPILLSGNVRMFARRAFSTSNRYQVQEERFDPADVVQLPEPRGGALLLGLLSLDASRNAFELTVHTDGTRIVVRRLGAQHEIGASMWSIVSKDPAMLALWAALIALLGLTNYHSQRLNNRLAKQAAQKTPNGAESDPAEQ